MGPRTLGVAPDAPLPPGFWVDLGPGVGRPKPDVLIGGSPRRILRLSATGVAALADLGSRAVVAGSPAATLGRRLTDAGMAVPCPPRATAHLPVTVVVPVRDRPTELLRCLRALEGGVPVVVVDDGSREAGAVAGACDAHGARLVRRARASGPAAARNASLASVETELVAFLDSDCVPPAGWLTALCAHFADPLVAAVAPRVVASQGSPRSPLDLGPHPAQVSPGAGVAYVPSAALVVRRRALGNGFDEALRFGEDVDLVWRLADAGWRVRYDPSVEVRHDEPAQLAARVRRRFAYGTSAGPLARRHPGRLSHAVLPPGPTAAVAAMACGRPITALGVFSLGASRLARRLGRTGAPARTAVVLSAGSVLHTWIGIGRWSRRFALPLVVAVVLWPGSRPGRLRRRLAALSTVAVPAALDCRADLGEGRAASRVALFFAEEAAYGAGVWAGCLRARTLEPVLPRLARPARPARPVS